MSRDFSEVKGTEDKGQSKTQYLQNSVRSIREGAFKESPIVNIKIPKKCQNIEKKAFEGCRGLKKVVLPGGLESIGEECFDESGLEEITIPKSVKTIEKRAFSGCENL